MYVEKKEKKKRTYLEIDKQERRGIFPRVHLSFCPVESFQCRMLNHFICGWTASTSRFMAWETCRAAKCPQMQNIPM